MHSGKNNYIYNFYKTVTYKLFFSDFGLDEINVCPSKLLVFVGFPVAKSTKLSQWRLGFLQKSHNAFDCCKYGVLKCPRLSHPSSGLDLKLANQNFKFFSVKATVLQNVIFELVHYLVERYIQDPPKYHQMEANVDSASLDILGDFLFLLERPERSSS